MSELTPVEEFSVWMQAADPGARCTYHRGFLLADRSPKGRVLAREARQSLNAVADLAWQSVMRGTICITQRRHGPEDYSYIAIKRQHVRPWVPGGSFADLVT